MEMNIALDTSFLIDLQRELRKGNGRAQALLQHHRTATLWVSTVAWGELVEGKSPANLDAIALIRQSVELAPISESVAERYAEITAHLRRRGNMIGTNDLWVAATALANSMPLATDNKHEFSRVPGLKLLSY
jgi:tRNA(fMet)-specific endonuclease VapC